MTSNVSVLSAPILCLKEVKSEYASHDEMRSYVHDGINKDIDAVLFGDRNRFKELVLGTPPCVSRPFLMKFP